MLTIQLPQELWECICTLLSTHDLANLCRISSHHLHIARYYLYKAVVLRSESQTISDTFALLLRNSSLSSRTTSLHLITHEKWWGYGDTSPWIDLEVLKMMGQLRSFSITRLPCKTVLQYHRLISLIQQHCPNLCEISILTGLQSLIGWSPQGAAISIKGLLRVTWSGDDDRLGGFAAGWIPLARSSMKTITHLNIVQDSFDDTYFSQFSTLTMPCLCVFTIDLQIRYIAPTTSFTTFLVRHPTIHTLSVAGGRLFLKPAKMEASMLPNLRSVSGDPPFIAALNRCCDSMKRVHALIFDFRGFSHALAQESIQPFTSEMVQFPSVKHFTIRGLFGTTSTIRIMENLLGSLPGLVHWTGGFYYRDHTNLKDVGRVLSQFPGLRRIDIYEWTFPGAGTPTPTHLVALKQFVSRFSHLERVCLYMPHLESNEISATFQVTRAGPKKRDVNLRKTYECTEEGPHIQEQRYVNLHCAHWRDDLLEE